MYLPSVQERGSIQMCSSLRWLAASAFAALIVVSPVLAADAPTTSSADLRVTVMAPGVPPLTALQPPSTTTAAATPLQLAPVQMARVPFNTLSTATLLPVETQAVGFRMSGRRASGGMDHHITWLIGGACIGAIVGLIDSDVVGKAAIGAGLGFGLSYVVQR
jgi:hypothetical protein